MIYKCGLCNESYFGEFLRDLNVGIGSMLESHHWQKRKLSLSVAPLVITCYFVTILCLLINEGKKIISELKESLLMMRDQTSL